MKRLKDKNIMHTLRLLGCIVLMALVLQPIAGPSILTAQENENVEKAMLCHETEAGAWTFLEVGAAAQAAHLAHGDFLFEGSAELSAEAKALWCMTNAPEDEEEDDDEDATSTLLRVVKVVRGGGPKVAADFNLFVDGMAILSGIATTTLSAGTHVVTETNDPHYIQRFGGDCNSFGHVVLEAGEEAVCEVINTFHATSTGTTTDDHEGDGLREVLRVCKEGPVGTYNFTLTGDMTRNFTLEAGECEDFNKDFADAVVHVSEVNLDVGMELDKIVYTQYHTPVSPVRGPTTGTTTTITDSNSVTATAGGSFGDGEMEGALVVFHNIATPTTTPPTPTTTPPIVPPDSPDDNPVAGSVLVCKQGPAGSFDFSLSGALTQNFSLASGSCTPFVLAGANASLTISEATTSTSTVLQRIDVKQLTTAGATTTTATSTVTGTNNTTVQVGTTTGLEAGAIVTFVNVATTSIPGIPDTGGTNPNSGVLRVCKEGPAGTFDFNLSGALNQSFSLASGNCQTFTNTGLNALISVGEATTSTSTVLQRIEVQQLTALSATSTATTSTTFTGSTTVDVMVGQSSTTPAAGAVVTFFNVPLDNSDFCPAPGFEVTSSGSIVSDTSTQVGGGNASLLTFIHAGWTANVGTSSQWIWSTDPVATGTATTTAVFTRDFMVNGTSTMGTLTIAADNTYRVWINDVLVGESTDGNNFELSTQDTYNVMNFLDNGTNTLRIEVTNLPIETGTPADNPAGLMYSLNWTSVGCSLAENTNDGGSGSNNNGDGGSSNTSRRGGGGSSNNNNDDDDDNDNNGEVLGTNIGFTPPFTTFIPNQFGGQVLGNQFIPGLPTTGAAPLASPALLGIMSLLALSGMGLMLAEKLRRLRDRIQEEQ